MAHSHFTERGRVWPSARFRCGIGERTVLRAQRRSREKLVEMIRCEDRAATNARWLEEND